MNATLRTRRSCLLLTCLLLVSVIEVKSFEVVSKSARKLGAGQISANGGREIQGSNFGGDTNLFSTKALSEDAIMSDVAAGSNEASWIDLPRTSGRNERGVSQKVEIVLGRFAMVSAVILCFGEVVYGRSILEQIMAALGMSA
uniref:High light inducible protein n=1 Tax=Trieres chinensis TaxID=1514140 RepID=A0A7S2ESR6_TRICV|mmetsp:Transcript_363/g.790  ORF Transcript_363/g.790 Transcript_363/m.790 type:complete len:143 (+) Transcript_363:92-520(+)|eukprot:CAMPEP_0183307262 /NCGR_PEP_ID=MMETSP0160_2-20130417/17228_1 /TAXON_ID=2839 ORGANISM="Odontella Sinensis, Strain Grunow 1884" /NCGR_SAMPLE_ID=MMETSP0160_2 /ASSEMBLY_ACC=CAM_ASM_000250 /LENGTH=142 /DNA_ID=CAMNT_0025470815 /DNA_START=92 /DNA_END=520 /DNA_ORIENTATION=+